MTHIGHSEKVFLMRAFIAALVLIFSLQSLTNAEDIRDFEIIGISIGDSALDHFDEKDIKKNLRTDWPNSKKFSRSFGLKKNNMSEYEQVMVIFKTKDNSFIIHGISATIFSDFKNCSIRKDKAVKEILDFFGDVERKSVKRGHSIDKDSLVNADFMYFENGYSEISCYDWSKKMEKKYKDRFAVAIYSEELRNWLNDEAY